jgi:hypothetical protein
MDSTLLNSPRRSCRRRWRKKKSKELFTLFVLSFPPLQLLHLQRILGNKQKNKREKEVFTLSTLVLFFFDTLHPQSSTVYSTKTIPNLLHFTIQRLTLFSKRFATTHLKDRSKRSPRMFALQAPCYVCCTEGLSLPLYNKNNIKL